MGFPDRIERTVEIAHPPADGGLFAAELPGQAGDGILHTATVVDAGFDQRRGMCEARLRLPI